ncbi:MAG: choice-of-anchor B family protein [Phycisphaerales bacterium]
MHASRPAILLAATAAAASTTLLFAHVDDAKVFDRIPPFIGPAYRAAEGGLADAAGQFTSSNVTLLSWLPLSEWSGATNANVVEHYVSPSGREYALLGLNVGTAFVEVTNPSSAQKIALLSGPNSLWRDLRVYGHHAYAASEGGGGIQVFDLSQIDSGVVTLVNTVTTGGNAATHTIFVDQASGFLYRCGGAGNGLRIYSLADPSTPTFVGQWQDKYVHEVTVVPYDSGPYAGKQIAFCCGGLNNGYLNSGLSILDVTNKSSIQVLSTLLYPNAVYSHQCWLTPDHKYAYLDDELDESNLGIPGTTHIIDIQNLSSPAQVATYSNGNTAIDHNLYVKGTMAFMSNYRSGLRLVDVSNPLAPVETGFFDTFPGSDSANFNGLWDNDPYLPSGTVLGSDIERGLFVWYVGPAPLNFSFPDGLPALLDPAGQELTVQIGGINTLTVVPGSVFLKVQTAQGVLTVPATESSPGVWVATSPALVCTESVSYSFTAKASNGIVLSAPTPGAVAVAAVGAAVAFADNMESDIGWTSGAPGDTATFGQWVRVDPIGTTAQPEDDNPAGVGTLCWVTGQGTPGGQAGEADVDFGITTLTSPIFDATGDGEAIVEYARWYSNNLGNNPAQDSMPISISNDGGATWTLLETVTDSRGLGSWRVSSSPISFNRTANMRLRGRRPRRRVAGRGGRRRCAAGSLRMRAAPAIPGDLNGDGVVDGADLDLLLGAWALPGVRPTSTATARWMHADLGLLLGNWGSRWRGHRPDPGRRVVDVRAVRRRLSRTIAAAVVADLHQSLERSPRKRRGRSPRRRARSLGEFPWRCRRRQAARRR